MAAQVTDEARDWRREYKEYINSPEWTVIRKAAYRRADGRCNRCKRRGVLHAHHLTYVRFGGAELPEDLEVLCEKCHTAEHAPKRAKRDVLKCKEGVASRRVISTIEQRGASLRERGESRGRSRSISCRSMIRPIAESWKYRRCDEGNRLLRPRPPSPRSTRTLTEERLRRD
jgi:hypothetical protein